MKEGIGSERQQGRDHRREKRLPDRRIGFGRFLDQECLALVEDVSMNGARVALYTERPVPPDAPITIDASYEDDWVTFEGHVRYALPQEGAWVVGIRCSEDVRRRAFLCAHYEG